MGEAQTPRAGAVTSYLELAREVLRRPPRLGAVRLVAVDGPSGAGKTHFADRLAAAVRAVGGGDRAPAGDRPAAVTVVRSDDLLDGWEDQFTFWPRLEAWVLAPLRHGRPGAYRRYDWAHDRFGDQEIAVPPGGVVILEGVSTARAVVRPELTLSVFVTVPDDVGLARAVRRDGEALRPRLRRWRRAERPHFAGDRTRAHVDLVVAGAADLPYDPATQFVRVDAPADLGDDRR